MIGNGENKKSMAYIHNVVEFLEACITIKQNYAVYNYVDTPDLTMNELVSQVRLTLKGKANVGPRLPKWFGISVGYLADAVARMSNKNLPISSIRVSKFISTTHFKSNKYTVKEFKQPYTIQQGISRTLHSEFIQPDPKREIFYTE